MTGRTAACAKSKPAKVMLTIHHAYDLQHNMAYNMHQAHDASTVLQSCIFAFDTTIANKVCTLPAADSTDTSSGAVLGHWSVRNTAEQLLSQEVPASTVLCWHCKDEPAYILQQIQAVCCCKLSASATCLGNLYAIMLVCKL